MLGIPAGCKIHSGVYGVTPAASGRVAARMIAGELLSLVDAEVMDIDEEAFRAGKVRAIAVTGTKRDPSLPDVPTVAEAGVAGYSSVPWYTISAPSGVPAPIVNKLNAEINAVLKAPDLIERWQSQGVVALGGTQADAIKRNQVETVKWNAVITAANIKVD